MAFKKGIKRHKKPRKMHNAFKKLKMLIREKFTVMVVPHSQRGVKNLNLSRWIIFSVIIVLISITSLSVVVITKYVYLSVKQKRYIADNEAMIKELEGLIYNSDNLIHVQKNFSTSLNSLLKTAGLSEEIFFNEVGIGGPLVNPASVEESQNLQSKEGFLPEQEYIFSQIEEIKDLSKIETEMSLVNKKIAKLSNKLKYFEKVTRFIPSIWPILGDGEITKSNASTMVINTLPFTPVVATANGKITAIAFEENNIRITIAHKYQFLSVYSNLYLLDDKIKEGDTVKKGDILGYVAKNLGNAQLKYSMYIGNKNGLFPVNPVNFTHLGR